MTTIAYTEMASGTVLSMATKTVRIPTATHEKLRQIASQSGMSLSRTLAMAVETLRRQALLEETNRAYAALRGDPEKWTEERAERIAWDATLADGLADV
jgi:hypothetical protein